MKHPPRPGSRLAAGLMACLAATTILAGIGMTTPVAADAAANRAAAQPAVARPLSHPNLDPGTIGLCNGGFGSVTVKRFTTPTLGTVSLLCGDGGSGYVHIRRGWETAWQKALNGQPHRALWDDFMVFAASSALSHPSAGYPRRDHSALCYSATVRVTTSSGKVLRTLHPTVIVAPKSKTLVTAIPTASGPTCSLR